jgi:hypothetical protein
VAIPLRDAALDDWADGTGSVVTMDPSDTTTL